MAENKPQKVNLRALFNRSYAGQYVSPIEIDKPTTVKITGFSEEMLTPKPWQKDIKAKERLILHFEGKDKGLIIKNINFRKLVEMFGWDTADWAGKEIVLEVIQKKVGGRIVATIEVRPAGPVNPTLAKEGIEVPEEGHGEEVISPDEVTV